MKFTTTNMQFHEGTTRLSVAHLLVAIVVIFVATPFASMFVYGRFIEAVIFSVMLLAATNAIGGHRRTLVAAAILVTPAIATRWMTHFSPGLVPTAPSLIATIVFVMFVIWHLLGFVARAPRVTSEVLYAAVSIYLLYAVTWASIYELWATWHPDAFTFVVPVEAHSTMSGFTALYFSAEVLTSLAFGDIMPVSNVARMMTLVEATSGLFFMTIMIARLVSLYSRDAQQRKS